MGKKKNGNLPARPLGDGCIDLDVTIQDSTGLTKREMFAMAAFQSLMTNSKIRFINSHAKMAVKAADMLLYELEKAP